MRKLVSVFAMFSFVLSLAAVLPALAAEQSAQAASGKTVATRKAPKSHQLTGTVEAVDATAGTIRVKGRKVSVSLDAGEGVSLEKIAVGDKVFVKYSGEMALIVKKVSAKTKQSTKEPMTKAVHKAEPAAPAAPAEKK
jgi:hypothetical protein